MKKYILLFSILILSLTSAQTNSQFGTEKIFFGDDQKLGGECVLKNSKISVDGEISLKTFEIEVPADGDYYLSAWVMNTGIIEKNKGLKFYFDDQKSISGKIKPEKEGWQSSILTGNEDTKSKKIKLAAGKHFLTFCSTIPEIPPVEFVRLSKNEAEIFISELGWNNFIENAKNNMLHPDYSKRDTSGSSKLLRVLPNPGGDYLHEIDAYFTYTYAATFYFDAGTNVILETKRTDPCASDPVMYLFNSSDPVNGGSWSADNGGECTQSKITCSIQNSGIYWVLIRSKSSNGSQTTNLYLNNTLYASNVAVSGVAFTCDFTSTNTINYFTANTTQGDPKLWIESYDGRILAYNDDYSGSGDFVWQQNARVKKLFNQRLGKCFLTSSSSYYSTGHCDVYMKCQNLQSNSILYDFFPYLRTDDAIFSDPMPSEYYNCISWTGGLATDLEYEWPPWDVPWSNPDINNPTPPLTAFDNYYGNKNYLGQTFPRYNGSWNYTRNGANSGNNQIDLWSFIGGGYSHASINSRWAIIGNPANGQPHGYDWESKIGPYDRIFHTRYALRGGGYAYGEITNYYRWDGTYAGGGLYLAKDYKGMSLEKSISSGLSTMAIVELSESENGKLTHFIETIGDQVKEKFNDKYHEWRETWNNPEIAIQSNPSKYTKSKQYEEFISFCKENGKSIWPLLFKNYINGKYYDILPIRELVFPNFNDVLKEISHGYEKLSYTDGGVYIVPSPRAFNVSFIKKVLQNPIEIWSDDKVLYNEQGFESLEIPSSFILEQNYPNPFNPSTRIKFGISANSRISLKIFNVLGKEVASLIDDKFRTIGWYNVEWNSKDNTGNLVSSGVYFCRLIANEQVKTIKLILIK